MKSKSATETLFLPKSNEAEGWKSFCELCTKYKNPSENEKLALQALVKTSENFSNPIK